MGLFFKNEIVDPDEINRKLIENHTPETLLKMALFALCVDISHDDLTRMGFSSRKLKEYYDINAKLFTRGEKNEYYSADDFFSLAEEAGSADAAFFMGIIYEHGLLNKPQNQLTANEHYNLATVRGSKLVAALKYLKDDHMRTRHDLVVDQYESLAHNMHSMCHVDAKLIPEAGVVREMLSKEELKMWLQISVYLLFFYATKECPYAMGSLVLLLSERSKMLKKGSLYDYICTDAYAATISQYLGVKLWNMAKSGDERAVNVCRTYRIMGN